MPVSNCLACPDRYGTIDGYGAGGVIYQILRRNLACNHATLPYRRGLVSWQTKPPTQITPPAWCPRRAEAEEGSKQGGLW